jgi:hypothetical protein
VVVIAVTEGEIGMPCDTETRRRTRTKTANQKREEKYNKLKEDLKSGKAKIIKQGNNVEIQGWNEREDWCDECVIRRLRQSSDFLVRKKVNDAVPQMEGISFGHKHTH